MLGEVHLTRSCARFTRPDVLCKVQRFGGLLGVDASLRLVKGSPSVFPPHLCISSERERTLSEVLFVDTLQEGPTSNEIAGTGIVQGPSGRHLAEGPTGNEIAGCRRCGGPVGEHRRFDTMRVCIIPPSTTKQLRKDYPNLACTPNIIPSTARRRRPATQRNRNTAHSHETT